VEVVREGDEDGEGGDDGTEKSEGRVGAAGGGVHLGARRLLLCVLFCCCGGGGGANASSSRAQLGRSGLRRGKAEAAYEGVSSGDRGVHTLLCCS